MAQVLRCLVGPLRELRLSSARGLAARVAWRQRAAAAAGRSARYTTPAGTLKRAPPSCTWCPTSRGQQRQLHSSTAVTAAAATAAGRQGQGCSYSNKPHPVLNWKVGVALAGTSFEAYNELSARGVPEQHEGGSEVYYIDEAFLRQKMAGPLRVTIRGAGSLPAAAPGLLPRAVGGSNPDPSCSLSVGDSVCQIKSALPSQIWQEEVETCTLFVRDIRRQSLTVRIMDSASPWSGQADTYLGSAVKDLRHICDGQRHELDLELRGGEGSASASVHLSCRFLHFSEVLAQDVANSDMGGPVVGTPGQIPLAADWQELLQLAGIATHTMLKPLAYVENAHTDTQAWVYWNKEERTACVAFRGTEQGKWRDILTDLHLVPAPLDPDSVAVAPRKAALAEVSQPHDELGHLDKILRAVDQAKEQRKEAQEASSERAVAAVMSTVWSTAEDLKELLGRVRQELEVGGVHSEADQPWVHSGFLTVYDAVRPSVLSLLTNIVEGEEGAWWFYFTGHSLGGALATLCAWDCSHRRWPLQQQPELVVYNFGSPRVGNRAFADDYNQRVPSTWRIVNAADAVCTVPRLMGYAHVGHAVHLRDGEAEVEMHTTEKLGEGISLPDVAPAVNAVVQATVMAKVPDLLPAAAVDVLTKVGIEVAAAGDDDAAAAAAATSGDSSEPGDATHAAAAEAITQEQLPRLWQQELAAWRMLLDGSSLDNHMEPLYLENLRAYLQVAVEAGSGSNDSDGNGSSSEQQALEAAMAGEGVVAADRNQVEPAS